MDLQKEKQEILNTVENRQPGADRVEITFYTDPLCCWSWAFEPQWRRLQFEYQDKLAIRNVMSGLLPSWKNYNDPMYSVSRPMQMGPVWLEASTTSGMPINDRIWVEDPPASSYPACIAVKCAELQSPFAGVVYLRLLREAVMLEGKNIAHQQVLTVIAKNLESNYPGLLDIEKFVADLTNDKGIDAFRTDWQEVQNRNINRFPTLIIRGLNKAPIMLTGYRPYTALVDAIKQISPTIEPFREAHSVDEYKQYWGSLTRREIEEIL